MARLNVDNVIECASAEEWEAWLERNHASASEVWLRLARKGGGAKTVSRAEAVEVALCYDWIDGQSRRQDEVYWLQRFTPRTRRSKWSELNCEAAEAGGRWAVAYAPPGRIEVPPDLAAALEQNPEAAAFFRAMDARNRYAILYRIQDAKKPETRARRIEKFVDMLARGEKIY